MEVTQEGVSWPMEVNENVPTDSAQGCPAEGEEAGFTGIRAQLLSVRTGPANYSHPRTEVSGQKDGSLRPSAMLSEEGRKDAGKKKTQLKGA